MRALAMICVVTLAGCYEESGGDRPGSAGDRPAGSEVRPGTPEAQRPPEITCAAIDFQHLVGQPKEAAEAVPDPKRVLGPGSIMTMDHRPNRTNVFYDEDGIIERISCG